MNLIVYIILIIEIILLVIIDKTIWKTIFTPVSFLSIPYFIILTCVLLFGPSLGFYQVFWPSVIVWVIGLFIFWLPSPIFGLMLSKEKIALAQPFKNINSKIDSPDLIKFLTMLCLIFVYYKIIILGKQYGWGTEEFAKKFGVGLAAHLSVYLKFILVYFLVVVNRKEKLICLFIVLILGINVLYNSKTWIFIPLFAGLSIRFFMLKNYLKISWKLVIVIALLIFIVFFLIYYFTVGQHLSLTDYIKFLTKHIALYFFAGIVSFSEYIKNVGKVGIDPSYIFISPINFYHFLFGGEIKNITSNIWTEVNNAGNLSNVKTLFGTIYIYSGWLWGIFFTFLFACCNYLLFITCLIEKHIILISIYAVFLMMLLFGWFEFYYGNLSFYEIPSIGLLVFLITKYRFIIKVPLKVSDNK